VEVEVACAEGLPSRAEVRLDAGSGPASAVRLGQIQWLAAMRWQKQVDAALAFSGLTFLHWLVLDATDFLFERTGDAVSQSQVSACLELDRMRVSDLRIALAQMGLVDRGPSASGRAWRIIVMECGRCLLRELEQKIRAASATQS
jgi:DNA-binding MarR family transcriptional regulator